MKKLLFFTLVIISTKLLIGQIKTNAGTFNKPSQGQIIGEITFAPNLTGTSGMFSLPTLNKGMETFGLKARKFMTDDKVYRVAANLSLSNSGEQDAKTAFLFGAGFGIEKHLIGAERLSTYWGYEANFGINKDEAETQKIGFGASAFSGFDYYFSPKLYLGIEVAYGFSFVNTTPKGGKGATKFELAPGVTPFMRLGWNL